MNIFILILYFKSTKFKINLISGFKRKFYYTRYILYFEKGWATVFRWYFFKKSDVEIFVNYMQNILKEKHLKAVRIIIEKNKTRKPD